MHTRPVLLILVTEDWYFCMHRLQIARAARVQGYRVLIAAQESDCREIIEREGLELIPMRWSRDSLNPLRAISEIREAMRVLRMYKPDLVHLVALRPSLYGGIAAWITGVRPVVNNLAGLGGAFCSKGLLAALLRSVLTTAFRILFRRKNSCTIVENSDDRAFLLDRVGLRDDQTILILGVGVDENEFRVTEERNNPVPVVTLVSRLLWPKGIGELVEAGRQLRLRGRDVQIRLVGMPDEASRQSVPEAQLLEWQSQGCIDWLGHRDDIPAIWAESNIAVLPSWYREGIPRSLLEAAACGRAIITTNMPGCREIVQDNVNGLLVPPRDIEALADAIEKLAADPGLRMAMGSAGRDMVERNFTQAHVVEQTLTVYEDMLKAADKLR